MSSAPATLYIPVHKRSTTPTSEHESSPELHLPIYSIQDLLKLSKSPLAVISAEHRDHIKETVPEISISRRQRKAIEHRQLIKEHARAARAKELSSALPNPKATTVQIQRRLPRQGRIPDRRRSGKIVDDLSSGWNIPKALHRAIPNMYSPLLLLTTTSA